MHIRSILTGTIVGISCFFSCSDDTAEMDRKKNEPSYMVCTLPDEFIVLGESKYVLYFNEFIRGNDTGADNTLKEYIFEIESSYPGITCSEEAIHIHIPNDRIPVEYPVYLKIFDLQHALLYSRYFVIKAIFPDKLTQRKNIWMLGDSWTATYEPGTGKGYVYFIKQFFEETANEIPCFIGTQKLPMEDIFYEAEGGTTIESWVYGKTSPLWNRDTKAFDFTNYRQNVCGLDAPLDLVNIQLGVNESIRKNINTYGKLQRYINAYLGLIDAILHDSPDCRIIINPCGLDQASYEAWPLLYKDQFSKDVFQINVYKLRMVLWNALVVRNDFGKNVFWGQSVLGLDRWNSYENATHPNMEGYKQLANTLGPQLLYVLQQ